MFYGAPQRLVVNLSPIEVLERIEAQTHPEYERIQGSNVLAGLMANHRKHMDRVWNLQYIARLSERGFEIEATGRQASQMGMLQGTVTAWGNRTIIDARYAPNRNVWITVSVVLLFGTVGAIVCLPAIMALILGIIQYKRARYSQQLLGEFLPKLFADVAAPDDAVFSAELVAVPRAFADLGVSAPPVDDAIRTFTDSSGNFTFAAALVDVIDDRALPTARLRSADGREQAVHIHRLSAADQQWIQREVKRRSRHEVEANKKLAWRRMGYIMTGFLCLFLLTFGCMGCVVFLPFLQLFMENAK